MEKQTALESNAEYEAFVDKFKPKLTTDDCYTPPEVYEVVKRRWISSIPDHLIWVYAKMYISN